MRTDPSPLGCEPTDLVRSVAMLREDPNVQIQRLVVIEEFGASFLRCVRPAAAMGGNHGRNKQGP
jgi:hypothetical protein